MEAVIRVADRPAEANTDWSGEAPGPATSAAPCRIYNIGNNQRVELTHLIETLEKCLGVKAKRNLLEIQPGDVPARYADVDDLAGDVGFQPRTSIEEGVEKFVAWYRQYTSGREPLRGRGEVRFHPAAADRPSSTA